MPGVRSGQPPHDRPPPERPPAAIRAFVWVFLAAYLLCGALGIEAWPLTGWRLFSSLRTEHQAAWSAVSVDPAGHELRFPLSSATPADRGSALLLNRFSSLAPERRAAACRAWVAEARSLGRTVVAVRIYRLAWDLLPRANGLPASPPARMLRYTCLAAPR